MVAFNTYLKLERLAFLCVERRLAFTVYELTLAVRKSGEFILHDDSRDAVHGIFEAGLLGEYTRTLADLGGARGPCLIYHHPEEDFREQWIAVSELTIPDAEAMTLKVPQLGAETPSLSPTIFSQICGR